MQILSAASAFPKYYYPQDVLCRALEEYWGEQTREPRADAAVAAPHRR